MTGWAKVLSKSQGFKSQGFKSQGFKGQGSRVQGFNVTDYGLWVTGLNGVRFNATHLPANLGPLACILGQSFLEVELLRHFLAVFARFGFERQLHLRIYTYIYG